MMEQEKNFSVEIAALENGLSQVAGMSVTGAAALLSAGAGLAIGAGAYSARWPASQIYGRTLIAPRHPGEIALTFDDGPNPRWTPLLLDTLAQRGVKATFFLIGKYSVQQPELVRRIHTEGHLIGNHTWSHPDLAITSKSQTREELYRTNSELESLLGAPIRYFRPPFGSRRPATLRIARELNLIPVMWNAMAFDWSAPSAEIIATRSAKAMEKNTKHGKSTNLLLHDGGHLTLEANRSASVAAAGLLVQRFSASHRFVKVEEW
jgi:peptidoglycan/xylan/chitin deacetylase (PgdA/CDA1 family)